jgi:hypothetical protein
MLSNSAENRRRAVLLPLGLLMLCMAVFSWGLQYKLSLYQSKNSIAHLAPEAKLLSQKERPAAIHSISQLFRAPVWPTVLIVALSLAPGKAAGPYLRLRNLEDGWSPPPACYRALFVRPPPTISLLLQD